MIYSSVVLGLLVMYLALRDLSSSAVLFGILSVLVLVVGLYVYRQNHKTTKKYMTNLINQTADTVKEKTTEIKPLKTDISFDDIAGIDDIKEELLGVVDFLNSPQKYLKHNISLPKGVLIVGPPGVGKTMIAKAMASTASCPFYYHSGASFVQIYVGMGAKKVRELFETARANAPAIVFIDEIDAIGKNRGVGNNDERDATLNELLTQMDGFLTTNNLANSVLTIGATNKVELLDDALLRPGRFDRQIYIGLPNITDRLKIIEQSIKNIRTNFDKISLASQTSGFSSAGVVAMINEAKIDMIKNNKRILNQNNIEVATKKIRYGKKQKTVLNKQQKQTIATYQASKAFVTKKNIKLYDEGVLYEAEPYVSLNSLKEHISGLLSGCVGVKVILGEEFVVFQSEIDMAYKIATDIKDKYKLSSLEPKETISECKEKLTKLIEKNKTDVLSLRDKLLQTEEI